MIDNLAFDLLDAPQHGDVEPKLLQTGRGVSDGAGKLHVSSGNRENLLEPTRRKPDGPERIAAVYAQDFGDR